MTTSDKQFVALLEMVSEAFNKRLGKETCPDLDSRCFTCKKTIVVAYMDEWIDFLKD